MSKKEVIFCDGCNKPLDYKNKLKISKIILEGEEIYNGIDGYDKITFKFDFCERCAKDIKKILEILSKK